MRGGGIVPGCSACSLARLHSLAPLLAQRAPLFALSSRSYSRYDCVGRAARGNAAREKALLSKNVAESKKLLAAKDARSAAEAAGSEELCADEAVLEAVGDWADDALPPVGSLGPQLEGHQFSPRGD